MGSNTLEDCQRKLFKEVQNKITVDREPDHKIFNMILEEFDFTKLNQQDGMVMFYNLVHQHVIHPLQEENKMNWKETGRLILEAFDADRERMLLEQKVLNEENTSEGIRSFIQEAREKRTRKTPKKI